jgi:hypothetical protein
MSHGLPKETPPTVSLRDQKRRKNRERKGEEERRVKAKGSKHNGME